MTSIRVDIVSAEGEVYSGIAQRVVVPGILGDLGIAARHSAFADAKLPSPVS